MTTRRLPADAFLLKEKLPYNDIARLHPLYDKCAFKTNLSLIGAKGIGKSLSIAAYAQINGIPIVTYDCSEDTRRYHLLGMYVAQGEETPFIMGPLPTAIEIANEVGHCILVLEEMNALTPAAQKMLNPLTDFRRKVELPEAEAVFKLNADAKLWVLATMNESVYGGVYTLNEDLKSRFRFLRLQYPSVEDERQLIFTALGETGYKALGKENRESILRLALETRQPGVEYALSPRDVVQLCEDFLMLGKDVALKMVVSKFEDAEVDTMTKRVSSIFTTNVDKV